jgi:DNA-directed RNA polymerase subunit RPC12/RpoP
MSDVMTLIKCKNCKKQISDQAKTCIHCGEKNERVIVCPECNNKNTVNDSVCSKCGYPLKTQFEDSARKACKAIGNAVTTIAEELDKIVTKK